MTQAAFARLVNVSRARVSQWIRESKIYGPGLVTEAGKTQVRTEVAKAQLRRHLDIAQRHSNGINTRLVGGVDAVFASGVPEVDVIEEQIKRERLEALQRDNRKRAEDEAARRGFYTKTDDVRQQLGRVAAQEMAVIEGRLGQIATTFAAKFPISQRDALHLLRSEFRVLKSQASAELRAAAAALPEFIEENLPLSDDAVSEE
jgi:hypothetical protein